MKTENIPSFITIVEYFEGHSRHSERYGKDCISWNIKISKGFNGLQEKHYEEYGLDKKWDEKWEEYCKENDSLFWDACCEALYFVEEGYITSRTHEFEDFKMCTAGRLGGWLELHEFEGEDMRGFDLTERIQDSFFAIYVPDEPETEEMAMHYLFDTILYYIKLYQFCKTIDSLDPDECYLGSLAHIRSIKEEEWEDELRPAEHPDQLYLFPELKKHDKIMALN